MLTTHAARAVALLEELKEKTAMPLDLTPISDQLSKLDVDVSNVQAALSALSAIETQNTALQAQVVDLQAQLASGTGVTQADLDAIASRVQAIDAAFDLVTGPDTPAATPPADVPPADTPPTP